jgi:hypothetical protein
MELDEPFDFPARHQTHTAIEIFHPGVGTVTAGRGESLVPSHPSTREFRLKIAPGDQITRRESLGQDTGYLLYASDSPAAQITLKQQLAIDVG